VTHFRISNISGGTLFLADGTTVLNDGDFINVAQGQAGLRFTPAAGVTEGHFEIEASEDGSTVASQSGSVTATIMIVASPPITAPEIPGSEPDELPAPVETVEEVAEEAEETADTLDEVSEQVAETHNPLNADVAADTVSASTGNPFNTLSQRMVGLENNSDALMSSDLSSVQSLLLRLETTKLETLKNAWDALYIKPLTVADYDLVRRSFDAIRDEMNADGKLENAVVRSAIITSMGLSAGYVFWMLKGGSLLASVLSSMPAWYLTDPLSILSGMRDEDEDEDDESLENIIEQGAEPVTEDDDDEQGHPS